MNTGFLNQIARSLTVLSQLALLSVPFEGRAQAPAVLVGSCLRIAVTSGSPPLASSGYCLFVPDSAPVSFKLYDIYGIEPGPGMYSYVRLNSTNASMTFWGDDQIDFIFDSTNAGSYTESSPYGPATGNFELFSMPAPDSMAGKTLVCEVEDGATPFGHTGTLSFIASGNKYTIVGDGSNTTDRAGSYVYSRLNPATGKLDMYDSMVGSNTMYIAFSNATAGGFSFSTRRAFQIGHFVLADTFNLGVVAQPTMGGSVSGGGACKAGSLRTAKATPAADYIFVNWTENGKVVSTSPSYNIMMGTDHNLVANFILNPFAAAQGNYAGLFLDTNSVGQPGFFTASLTRKGTFSAKVLLSGHSYSLSGSLSAAGTYSNSFAAIDGKVVSVQLQADLVGAEVMSGVISGDNWASELAAHRSVYSRSAPAPQGGNKYTIVIAPGATDSTQPDGYGYGALTVDASGNISFKGTLGDGTKVAQKTFISSDGQWPFYLSPYLAGGGVFGWLSFSNATDSDIQGLVSWNKPMQPGARYYPFGFAFTNGLGVSGSSFQFFQAVPVAEQTNEAYVVLQGGNLAQSITNDFTISSENSFSNTNKSSLKIAASGLFQGGVPDPATGKSVSINGAWLQKQNVGFGTFIGTNQTGSVSFVPPE